MFVGISKYTMHSRIKLLSRNFGVVKNVGLLNAQHGPNASLFQTRNYSDSDVHSASTPMNTIIVFVPQQEAWIVERMGKFDKILSPGVNFLLPILDKVKYVQNLKELAIDVPKQSAITSDNVTLNIDGVLYLKIHDPYLASYGVDDPEFAIIQLAQTTMRSELGKISLDKVFREREELNVSIVETINKASKSWGISCLRYEIRDIKLPPRVHDAMQMQVEAERKKRAAILESEGARTAEINIAEGKRLSRILASEAEKQEQINRASGEATALVAVAEARAKVLQKIANALGTTEAKNAASLNVAEQYVAAFNHLAKVNNTVIIPTNMGDMSSLVTQALAIYKHVMPLDNVSKEQISNDTNKEDTKATVGINSSDDTYEYFSDKEDAERHRKADDTAPKLM